MGEYLHKSKRSVLLVAGGIVLCSLALAMFFPTTRTRAEDRERREYPKVIDSDSVVFGRTFGEWSAAWWQWAFSIPAAKHPLFDNGDCDIGQSGPVWFLGGKFCQTGQNAPPCTPGAATRSCTLPAGKAVYFPIFNGEDSAPEEPTYGCGNQFAPLLTGTIAEMRKCIEFFTSVPDASAEIDGRTIPNLIQNYRVESTVFGVTAPDDNFLKAIGENIPAGTYFPVVDDGVYLMLAPLSPGHHYLHFAANGGQQNITYHLVVMH